MTAGLFLIPPVTTAAHAGYDAVIDTAVEAERLGFDSVWLAEGHVSGNGLPSALTFLAALSQRTSRVRLGTAVITPAFENPIRLAEVAGVVEALSGGRLELGLGKSNGGGWSSPAFAAFALDERDRDALFADAVAALRAALGGVVDGTDVALFPPAAVLRSRLWQATGRPESARAAGRVGDGLQLHRKAAAGSTGEVQSRLIDAYLEALPQGVEPRVATSRVVLPAADRAEAVALFEHYSRERPEFVGHLDRTTDVAAYLTEANIAFGAVDDVVRTLRADAAAQRSTTVLYSIPLPFDVPEYRRALAVVTKQIHPLAVTGTALAAPVTTVQPATATAALAATSFATASRP
jgi:alkanesulfonate monooxygenase SsuD/methylene tetrahydromethanopterin reductase-like flavin-dependent oxidoreductase (luciferase family)